MKTTMLTAFLLSFAISNTALARGAPWVWTAIGTTYSPSITTDLITYSVKHKIVQAQDDAAYFVATEGEVKGAQLDEALSYLRQTNPELNNASDLEIAAAILEYK